MDRTVLIIANVDTRGAEFRQYVDLVRTHGLSAVLMDVSMEQPPSFPGDISCEDVAAAGGSDIATVRKNYREQRDLATAAMVRGGRAIAQTLFSQGRIHGVFGCGGATAALIATSIMKALPFGVPKVMATSVAGHPRYVASYVGTSDVTLLNTVVDVMGSNPLLDAQLRNGIGAICGMVRGSAGPPRPTKPVVGITSFGFAERCVEPAIHLLREAGFDPVPFHAQGRGDRAMDEMVRAGQLAGVIDVVTRGIGEELLGGNCAAGQDRVRAAAETGIPMVVAPSGLDMLSVGGQEGWRERFAGRAHVIVDKLRVMVRTSAEECQQMARILAERLNRCEASYRVVLPRQGWSSLSAPGGPLWDPSADAAFVEELKYRISRPDWVQEVDHNLYTSELGQASVAAFIELWQEFSLEKPALTCREEAA
jgi:uncharacterized protein (UPF0261 family)